MRFSALAGVAVLAGTAVLALAPRSGQAADTCSAPIAYPGDSAAALEIADWLAHGARSRTIPAELPVMAALVESGLKNLIAGDSDSAGYFGMRRSIWDTGAYAGFPTRPELQLTWFLDQAIAVRTARVAAGDTAFGTDPGMWGEWIADVERPAEQFRGLYQLRLDEARGLIPPCALVSETLGVTTEGLPPATVGSAYLVQLTASGGSNLTWSLAGGTLPGGLTLTPDGALSGTPTTPTASPVAIVLAVTSGTVVATKSFSLDVVGPLTITRPRVIPGERGRPLRPIALLAQGGRSPYTWDLVDAPAWLAFDRASARLSGTPPSAGSFPVRVALRDAYETTVSVDLTLTVRRMLRIRQTILPVATVGKAYRARLRTVGGVPAFRWRTRGLPAGIAVDRATGRFGGRPLEAGRYAVAVTVEDVLGASSTTRLGLTVRAAGPRR
jgi:hypothetical protein